MQTQNTTTEIKPLYVISWDSGYVGQRYHANGETNGTGDINSATTYETEADAQAVIESNNWVNCYVCEFSGDESYFYYSQLK